MAGFEVTGWDRGGKVVFHMGVEAPNDVVAVLYATGHLRRTDGSEAVIKAAKVEARAVVRQGRKYPMNRENSQRRGGSVGRAKRALRAMKNMVRAGRYPAA
jgi:hypothetical protein